MFYLHVYVITCAHCIHCMKMHNYFLLNIKHGASQLHLGPKYNCEAQGRGRGGGGGKGPLWGPGEGPLRVPPGGLQLSSAGTGYSWNFALTVGDLWQRSCSMTIAFTSYNDPQLRVSRSFYRRWVDVCDARKEDCCSLLLSAVVCAACTACGQCQKTKPKRLSLPVV